MSENEELCADETRSNALQITYIKNPKHENISPLKIFSNSVFFHALYFLNKTLI